MVARCLAALAFLIAAVGVLYVTYAQADDTSALAAAAYEAGRYGEAIQLYETISAANEASGAIYYNLGNAYFQAGELGRALLNYRRAQRELPRDSEVDAAIVRVVSQRRDVVGDDPRLLAQLALLTAEVTTQQELAWSALLCWTLFCVTLGVALLKTEAKARPPALDRPRISRARLTQVVTVAMVVILVLFGLRLIFEEMQPAGVVVVGQSAVMSGPGEDYLHLYDLSAAAEVYILEERAGWVHFAMADGRQGWLEASAVEAVNP